jgi:hypothetical protein
MLLVQKCYNRIAIATRLNLKKGYFSETDPISFPKLGGGGGGGYSVSRKINPVTLKTMDREADKNRIPVVEASKGVWPSAFTQSM